MEKLLGVHREVYVGVDCPLIVVCVYLHWECFVILRDCILYMVDLHCGFIAVVFL